MKSRILVATPTLGFGELIRQSLEEIGVFSVAVTSNTDSSLQMAAKEPFALAILDSDLDDSSLPDLAQQLKETLPDLHLLVVPPDDERLEYDLQTLPVDGFLSKPFYLPDLLETVKQLLNFEAEPSLPLETASSLPHQKNGHVRSLRLSADEHPAGAVREAVPLWFNDQAQVKNTLSVLFGGIRAYSAFILRYDQIWAAVGDLYEPEIETLAATMMRQLTQGSGTDLARFVQLESCGGDCMLYATELGDEYVLAVIYDAEKPFSMIRKETGILAQNLRKPIDFSSVIDLADSISEETFG
ncbi:MAG: hypothetical protein ACK2UW_23990 [Anaerolineales bacterium]|jgi:DNA-binding NarL/FixJ family response regulator